MEDLTRIADAPALGISDGRLNVAIAKCLLGLKPERILEYGCGSGKLAHICQAITMRPLVLKAVQKLFTDEDIYKLRSIGYTDIADDDVLEYVKNKINEKYNLIVAMDVLEHFMYGDAISIIDCSLYYCDWFLVVWPSHYPQYSTNQFDRHRSSFELKDLSNRFDVIHYTQTGLSTISSIYRFHLAVIRGHQNLSVLTPPL